MNAKKPKTNVYYALAVCQALNTDWFTYTVSFKKHTKPMRCAVLAFAFHWWRCLLRLREMRNSSRTRGKNMSSWNSVHFKTEVWQYACSAVFGASTLKKIIATAMRFSFGNRLAWLKCLMMG